MIDIRHKDGYVLHTVDADTLVGADLGGVDLSGANLCGKDLKEAYLVGESCRS
jgi:uncharacterized protein YjbI with pentapeptide repeats